MKDEASQLYDVKNMAIFSKNSLKETACFAR